MTIATGKIILTVSHLLKQYEQLLGYIQIYFTLHHLSTPYSQFVRTPTIELTQ